MSTGTTTNHRKGLLLTAIGGAALTVDIPLIKLANGEPWSILALRSGATVIVALALWCVWRALRKDAPKEKPGRVGLTVAALYGLGSISFTFAVFNTSTANLVFILALVSMVAALMSWLFLGERPSTATFLAMGVTLVGVLVIIGGGMESGGLLGDALALCSTLLIAGALTISRASGRQMGTAALAGNALPFIVALVMVGQVGFVTEAPAWILFDGAVIMPIAFFCLATGPKYLSAPEVAMFYLLETVFAPIWVWVLFTEAPSTNSLIGGSIVVFALIAHALWQLAHGARKRAEPLPRHPA